MKPCILMLTCEDDAQADTIGDALLKQRLVVCVKKTSITSSFLWKGHQDSAKEVLLFMDSREDLFEEVERVVKKLHSYETFILVALPAIKSSKGVSDWMRHELK